MDSDEDIGRRLIALRERHEHSQVKFAKELHIAKNTLNGYETGKRPLTLETAKRIRSRWGISLDWLIRGDIGQPGHELALALGPRPKIEKDTQAQASKSGTPKKSHKNRKRA